MLLEMLRLNHLMRNRRRSNKFAKKLINRWNDWIISGSIWRAIWTSTVEVLVANVLAWGVIFLGFIAWAKLTGKNTEEDS